MANNSATLTSYSFTKEDIEMITFALRKLHESTGFADIKADSGNLLEYIEREMKDKGVI